MSESEKLSHEQRALASRLYVELIGRAFRGAEGPEQFKPAPQAMARLCYTLADAFLAVAATHQAADPEKAGSYQAQDADLVNWLK